VVRALHDRGVASLSAPIWLGNWAANKGEHIGTVRSILATETQVRRTITLFHGTDTFRLQQIMRTGLRAVGLEQRVWNKGGAEKVRPEHREEAVYLTASRPQAEYYARKAVNIDRARFGPEGRRKFRYNIQQTEDLIRRYTAALEHYATMTPEAIKSEDEWSSKYAHDHMPIASKQRLYPESIVQAQQVVDQAKLLPVDSFYGKIEPVILQATLRKSEFDRLMADDDFLARNRGIDPNAWEQSLSEFGQIAFKGVIPPDRLTVIAKGKDAGQVSR
jgi:hypothetical protein